MNTTIRTLKAEIQADLEAIAEIYDALERYGNRLDDEESRIVIAYHLHNLYCAFESIFQRIARTFGEETSEQAGWHAELLYRMGLDIAGVRPRVLSDATYDCLDELRRFRHLFRSAYRLRLDPDRLALVYKKARSLQRLYPPDLERFFAFLDELDQ